MSFRLSSNFLTWLASFLDGRSLGVVYMYGSARSQWVPALYGLPRGSVLGPLLYIIYAYKLGPLLTAHDVLGQLYAEDIQANLYCLASKAIAAVPAMTIATGALVAWMSSKRLRLNPTMTQYIWLGSRQQFAKLDLSALAARFPHIAFSVTVRYLGITLDQELTAAPHINRLCRDCYYQRSQLLIIPLSLTSTADVTLVNAFVTCRLDYRSTFYTRLPAVRLECL